MQLMNLFLKSTIIASKKNNNIRFNNFKPKNMHNTQTSKYIKLHSLNPLQSLDNQKPCALYIWQTFIPLLSNFLGNHAWCTYSAKIKLQTRKVICHPLLQIKNDKKGQWILINSLLFSNIKSSVHF